MRSEEAAGRAEPVLATAVSRGRWATSHLVVALLGSVAVLVAYGLAAGLTYGIASSDLGHVGELLAAALAFAPALWVLVGLTFALIGLVPRVAIAGVGGAGRLRRHRDVRPGA